MKIFLEIILWFLDQAGLVDQLTQFLVNLYEEQEKPTDAISYMRKALAQGKNNMFLGGIFHSTLKYEKTCGGCLFHVTKTIDISTNNIADWNIHPPQKISVTSGRQTPLGKILWCSFRS